MGSQEKHAGTGRRNRAKLEGRAKKKQAGMVGNGKRKADLLSDFRREFELLKEEIQNANGRIDFFWLGSLELRTKQEKLAFEISELNKLQNQDREGRTLRWRSFNETAEKLQSENAELKSLILDQANLTAAHVNSESAKLRKSLEDMAVATFDKIEALKK